MELDPYTIFTFILIAISIIFMATTEEGKKTMKFMLSPFIDFRTEGEKAFDKLSKEREEMLEHIKKLVKIRDDAKCKYNHTSDEEEEKKYLGIVMESDKLLDELKEKYKFIEKHLVVTI